MNVRELLEMFDKFYYIFRERKPIMYFVHILSMMVRYTLWKTNFMKNVSSTTLHFLSHRLVTCWMQFPHFELCWFVFQVLPDCGENRHKHEINFFRLSTPGSDALTLWMSKTTLWVSKGKESLHEGSVHLCQLCSDEQSGWVEGNRAMPQSTTTITDIYSNMSLLTKPHSCRSGLYSEKRK